MATQAQKLSQNTKIGRGSAASEKWIILLVLTLPEWYRAGERVRPPASLTRSTGRSMALPHRGAPEGRAQSRRQYTGRGPEIKTAWHHTTGDTYAYRKSYHDPW
jgi:hypothetical protein